MSTGKILVVDDEADIRVLLKEILSDEGYDVDVAANAGQARASRARGVVLVQRSHRLRLVDVELLHQAFEGV